MDIIEFVKLPHRFRWGGVGGDDCMTFPATWAERSIGVDPAEELRGTYRDREGAEEIIARFGGLVPMMGHQLTQIGAKRVQQVQDGDIGLIRAMTAEDPTVAVEKEIGAVRFGPLWAAIHPGGVRAVKAEFIAAWRLPA